MSTIFSWLSYYYQYNNITFLNICNEIIEKKGNIMMKAILGIVIGLVGMDGVKAEEAVSYPAEQVIVILYEDLTPEKKPEPKDETIVSISYNL